jgi:FkbM family methyltransferase
MESGASKIQSAIENPRMVAPYAKRRVALIDTLVRNSRYRLAAIYAADLLRGTDRYRTYLESNDSARYLDCDVLDFRMKLDLLDEGISRDLLVEGVREPLATDRYREELERLASDRGGLTVVDIGANIGYFLLLYLSRSRANGEAIAVEPHPENFSLLQENVALNDFERSVSFHNCAIGAESTSATMRLSTRRNLHTLAGGSGPLYVDEIDVPVVSLDELLAAQQVPFESVDVLRMDIQGYEYEAFSGMSRVLREGNVGLAFVEIHPTHLRKRGKYDEFLSTLQQAGFELVCAADGRTAFVRESKPTRRDPELAVDSIGGLRDVDFTVEVLLRR